jgi:hypothetical protein
MLGKALFMRDAALSEWAAWALGSIGPDAAASLPDLSRALKELAQNTDSQDSNRLTRDAIVGAIARIKRQK